MLTFEISILLITSFFMEVNLQHTDNQAIVFRYKEKYGTDFTVKKNEPLDIVWDNYFAEYGWCLNFFYTGSESIFVKNIHLNGSSDSVMHVPKVTDEMITKWWCVVLRPYQLNTKAYVYQEISYTAYNVVFNLHSEDGIRESTSSINKLDYMSIGYIIAGILTATIIILVTIIFAKKCCCKHKIVTQPQIPNPDRFYLNLPIFRQQYERELREQAQEPEYEEID